LLKCLKDLEWHAWSELEQLAGNRFGARLHELREAGYKIVSASAGLGKRYRLVQEQPVQPPKRKVKIYVTYQQAQALRTGVVTPAAKEAVIKALESYDRNLDDLSDWENG
jgi:phosphopantetheinyl transferase (holo-ACP synthase)